MLNLFKKNVIQDARGVGFDQHYTDSFLKLVAPKSYRKYNSLIDTQRSIPKQEILSSLLLFGKAYLSKPLWMSKDDLEMFGLDFEGYRNPVSEKLRRFENEDLIEWIPYTAYESACTRLNILIERLHERAYRNSRPILTRKDTIEYSYRKEENESELSHNTIELLEEIFYSLPLIQANLSHFKMEFSRAISYLFYPVDNGEPNLLPYWHFDRSGEYDDEYSNFSVLSKLLDYQIPMSSERYYIAAVLDSLLSSLAIEKFASDTSIPIKTNGGTKSPKLQKIIIAPEAYQLIKIQFQNLRYPVIETIDDVLRLRDDPHLKTYRLVIAEYSERLRQELESERAKVLRDFHKDIQSALNSLSIVKRWSKIIDFSFYVSLPLVAIGAIYNIPISDILIIPLTFYAKFVAHQKRKELDWILFGRASVD